MVYHGIAPQTACFGTMASINDLRGELPELRFESSRDWLGFTLCMLKSYGAAISWLLGSEDVSFPIADIDFL